MWREFLKIYADTQFIICKVIKCQVLKKTRQRRRKISNNCRNTNAYKMNNRTYIILQSILQILPLPAILYAMSKKFENKAAIIGVNGPFKNEWYTFLVYKGLGSLNLLFLSWRIHIYLFGTSFCPWISGKIRTLENCKFSTDPYLPKSVYHMYYTCYIIFLKKKWYNGKR